MTACESSGLHRGCFSITTVSPNPSHYTRIFFFFWWGAVVVDVAILSIISCFQTMSELFPLPVSRCWCCFFGGFDQTQKKAPSPSFFSL